MKWLKMGQVFSPLNNYSWLCSHAAVPFVDYIGKDNYRVYFCGRDSKNRGQIGYMEIDITRPDVLSYLHPEPVLSLGPLGAFDDHGLIGSSIVTIDSKKYLYYSGLTLGQTVPFYFYVGLGISDDGGRSFRKYSPAPILDRSSVDPYLTGQVCVLRENLLWKMWYVSGDRWEKVDGKPKHYYHIKYAESRDGIDWDRKGVVCIDFKEGDYAIARPSVIKDVDCYKMWYCYRGQYYKIGYSESQDGIHWNRLDDKVGIDISEIGWDSEMTAYPFVFDHRGERYMLYNGNDYGKTGIGLAKLVLS